MEDSASHASTVDLDDLLNTSDEGSDSVIVEVGDTEECPICMGPLEVAVCWVRRCNHKFHLSCVSQWLKTHLNDHKVETCPVCRQVVSKVDI